MFKKLLDHFFRYAERKTKLVPDTFMDRKYIFFNRFLSRVNTSWCCKDIYSWGHG